MIISLHIHFIECKNLIIYSLQKCQNFGSIEEDSMRLQRNFFNMHVCVCVFYLPNGAKVDMDLRIWILIWLNLVILVRIWT